MRVQKLESKSAADFLALTEEQKSEFKRIKDKHEADIADLRTTQRLMALSNEGSLQERGMMRNCRR